MLHMKLFDLTHLNCTAIVVAMEHDHSLSIALLAEYDAAFPPHPATSAALSHSANYLGVEVTGTWISTECIDIGSLAGYSAIWIAPGSPYKNLQKTLDAIRYARENEVPCLGTCGGFQHMLIEYARNVLGYADAQHAEYDPYASNLFISALACSPAGREMHIKLAPGSTVATCYGDVQAVERYYCNFGVNSRVVPLLANGPMKIAGTDAEGALRVLELPDHPFFVATLYVPQTRSRLGMPHPLVTSFVVAAMAMDERRALTRLGRKPIHCG
jgi:CTP synthase (UTP-ammonia lyase)